MSEKSLVKIKQGSVVKLVYSDGHEVHWTAAEDVTLPRALDTIGRLARLDPQWDSRDSDVEIQSREVENRTLLPAIDPEHHAERYSPDVLPAEVEVENSSREEWQHWVDGHEADVEVRGDRENSDLTT